MDVKGFPSSIDSKGRLYFIASKEGFPVMKRSNFRRVGPGHLL